MSERIRAEYLIETPGDLERAVAVMAGEQSSGTFVKLANESADLLERSGARVESLTPLGDVSEPSLPGSRVATNGRYRRGRVTLSWPLENLGPSLPNLVATVAGNLFELKDFSGLRLTDIELPAAFFERYPGPRFGVPGTRRLSGVASGPLVGTIIKPSVGLSVEETASLVGTLVDAGIDFIKDDELQANGLFAPFEGRARAVMQVINDKAERTGRKVMFAFNITDDLDQLRRNHDLVVDLGGTCVMVSLNSVGLAGVIDFARGSQLPIHAHRNGWGYLSRHPLLGWSYTAWQKIWRLAGVDHLHVNGLNNKFSEDNDSVMASAQACLTPMSAHKPCTVMPVFSSGQTVHQAAETYRRLGSSDLIFAAGGGIMGHPDGAAAGVASIRQSWDAAMAGIPAATYASTHPPLATALEAYSP